MAANDLFAPKYAQAFFTAASRTGVDTYFAQQQLQDFAALLRDSRELRETLMDPSVPAEQKLSVVDALAGRFGWYREVRNLVAVVIDHQRLDGFADIVREYHRVADQGQGVSEAEVVSARALNDEDRGMLEDRVARLAGRRVRITWKEDGALLGGAIVTLGSTVYDGSVRAQLDGMKRALLPA